MVSEPKTNSSDVPLCELKKERLRSNANLPNMLLFFKFHRLNRMMHYQRLRHGKK